MASHSKKNSVAGGDGGRRPTISDVGDLSRHRMSLASGAFVSSHSGDATPDEEEELDPEQLLLRDIREGFDMFDEEGLGYIDFPTLLLGTRSLGLNLTEAEVQDLIKAVDIEGSDRIEFKTLADLMLKHVPDENEVKEVFSLFDKDRNAMISFEDLASVSVQLGMDFTLERLQDILDSADIDHSGAVLYNDFREVFFMPIDEAKDYIAKRISGEIPEPGDMHKMNEEVKKLVREASKQVANPAADDDMNLTIKEAEDMAEMPIV